MMDDKLIVDPHLLSGQKENWTLRFTHSMFRTADEWNPQKREWVSHQRIGITLEADLPGRTPAMNRNVLIATALFPLGQKPDVIRMTTHPDAEDLVSAMLEKGYAKRIGERTERVQDYPGADDIDEFITLDVTDYYNRYMNRHQLAANESPLSHVFQCQGQVMNGKDPADYMKCRIGGIEQHPAWSGITGRILFQVAEYYPDCRFQLKELAAEVFKEQLERYTQAKARVTDATTFFNKNNGTHYLRCKIDGQQQLSKEINRLDLSDFMISKDIHALAAKYYTNELDEGMKRSQGFTR